MSIIAKIDKEIAALEKKKAAIQKKCSHPATIERPWHHEGNILMPFPPPPKETPMTDIHIPPEVVEAAVAAFDASEEDAYVSHADDIRAAIRAALAAWPECLVLPLPQEKSNAEG